MTRLKRKLAAWVGLGLITVEQEQNILTYEEGRGAESRSKWVVYAFISLGVFVVGIGFVSIIAANWDYIPGIVKLFFDFCILAVLALIIFRIRDTDKDYLWDGLLSLFAFLCLASVGLIAQVYHTGGEPWQALGFWLVAVIPVTHMARRKFLPHIWIFAFLATMLIWLYSDDSLWWLLPVESHYKSEYAILITMPFLCFFFNIVLEGFKAVRRYGEIFRLWSVIGGLYIAGAVDVYFSVLGGELPYAALIPMYILAALCLILLHLIPLYSLKQRIILSIMTVLIAVIFMPYRAVNADDLYITGDLIGAGFTIAILLLFGMLFILEDKRKLFNLATLLIGIRFLIIYFQVFGGLAVTGLGLIFSGMIIIGAALLWFKKRGIFEQWLGRKIR